jgi:hypothetical protein
MNAATSGVCLVRVEVQSCGLRFTVVTDYHDGSVRPAPGEFRDVEEAVAAVREFLLTFGRDGMTRHAR